MAIKPLNGILCLTILACFVLLGIVFQNTHFDGCRVMNHIRDIEICSSQRDGSSHGNILSVVRFRPCTVHLPCMGNLGNQFVSILYGLHIAKLAGSEYVTPIECYHGLLASASSNHSFTIQLGIKPVSHNQCSGNAMIRGWGTFYLPLIRPTANQVRDLAIWVYPHLQVLNFDSRVRDLVKLESTLTIYLRSGDIFTDQILSDYIQAPCSYFSHVVMQTKPSRVVIVTSELGSASNPCAHILQQNHSEIDFLYFLGSRRETYAILIHANKLVLSGYSSFGHIAGLFGHNRSMIALPVFQPNDEKVGIPSSSLKIIDFRWFIPSQLKPATVVHRYVVHGFGDEWNENSIAQLSNPHKVSKLKGLPRGYEDRLASYTTVLLDTLGKPIEEAAKLVLEVRRVAATFEIDESRTLLPAGILVLWCSTDRDRDGAGKIFISDINDSGGASSDEKNKNEAARKSGSKRSSKQSSSSNTHNASANVASYKQQGVLKTVPSTAEDALALLHSLITASRNLKFATSILKLPEQFCESHSGDSLRDAPHAKADALDNKHLQTHRDAMSLYSNQSSSTSEIQTSRARGEHAKLTQQKLQTIVEFTAKENPYATTHLVLLQAEAVGMHWTIFDAVHQRIAEETARALASQESEQQPGEEERGGGGGGGIGGQRSQLNRREINYRDSPFPLKARQSQVDVDTAGMQPMNPQVASQGASRQDAWQGARQVTGKATQQAHRQAASATQSAAGDDSPEPMFRAHNHNATFSIWRIDAP